MDITSTINATIIRPIGNNQGRNSEVFLAHDPQLNGTIAIKEIPVTSFSNVSEYFLEAQTYYANKHPRVVPVLYASQDASKVRLSMPYFIKGSMQDYINTSPLTIRKTIDWSQNFLSGLHHVHCNGYIHYDLKPTNVLIADDGSAMLTDFGQTREMNHLGVATNPPLYLFHYPPELFRNTHSTLLADIYQSGLTLYRMCNGEPFFQNQKNKYTNSYSLRDAIISGAFPNRNSFLPHIPDKMRRIIRKSLLLDPAKRYQSALELTNDLGKVSKLLDWEYIDNTTEIRWNKRTIEHLYAIVLLYDKSNNNWRVEGSTRKLPAIINRKKNSWCGGPFRTRRQGEGFIANLFREMEG